MANIQILKRSLKNRLIYFNRTVLLKNYVDQSCIAIKYHFKSYYVAIHCFALENNCVMHGYDFEHNVGESQQILNRIPVI